MPVMRPAPACLLMCSLALVPFLRQDCEGSRGGGIATLYASDDLLSSFDFRGGGAGGRVIDGEVRLDGAQIVFDLFVAGHVSIGLSRDERVDVLDLGPEVVPPRTRARDRGVEFPISIFHTLLRDDNGFSIVRPGGDVDPYERADAILTAPPTTGIRHFQPELGHTYLLRVRRTDSSRNELFKFLVIGIVPEHSLTIRWASLGG